jgi:hypothetical protein
MKPTTLVLYKRYWLTIGKCRTSFETIKRQIEFNLIVVIYQIIQEEKMDVSHKIIKQIEKILISQ